MLPRVEPLGALPFVEPAPTTETAIHSAPRRGHGPEYLGIREYRPGDSMRHVHWASTARHGQIMVREFEEERTRRLAIVVDAARDTEGDEAWTPLDRACSAAASVALAAVAHGHGARLVPRRYERGAVEVLAGADERELLERLALLAPADGRPRRRRARALRPGRCAASRPLLVFPTWDAHDPATLAAAVGSLTHGCPVVAVPVVDRARPRRAP